MRKLSIALFVAVVSWLALSPLAWSQGVIVPTQTALKTVNGLTQPIANATITVCAANASGIPCSPALVNAVFTDRTLLQPLGNPFSADANGNYTFAIAPGSYTVTVTASGYAGFSYQVDTPGTGGGGGSCGSSCVQYQFPGSYQVNQGTHGNSDAIQIFPCDQFYCTFVLGSYSQAPCCSQTDGTLGLTPTIFTSVLPHIAVSVNGLFFPTIMQADSPCDMADGCTGTGPEVRQNQGLLFSPSLWNPVTNNITINALDGDFFDVQPGFGKIIAGSVTSGTFQGPVNNIGGEGITQTSTGAQATFVLIEPTGALLTTNVVLGSPDNSHTWVGNNSGAVFTPTATPVVPYCQYAPTAGHDYGCFGSDGKFQFSDDGAPLAPVLTQGPSLPSDFTTANNTSLQNITAGGVTLGFSKQAKAAKSEFHCVLLYSQGTANAAVAFGIQAVTNAPINIEASGEMSTTPTAKTAGTLATLATTTATNIVSATPGATAAVFRAVLDGTIEDSAQANTFNIMVSTATGADAVTIKRGSSCSF
jgi:hypothetical protein